MGRRRRLGSPGPAGAMRIGATPTATLGHRRPARAWTRDRRAPPRGCGGAEGRTPTNPRKFDGQAGRYLASVGSVGRHAKGIRKIRGGSLAQRQRPWQYPALTEPDPDRRAPLPRFRRPESGLRVWRSARGKDGFPVRKIDRAGTVFGAFDCQDVQISPFDEPGLS